MNGRPAPNAELAQLVSPLTPDEFIRTYWERKPVHISGAPGRFESLFDRAAFREVIAVLDAVGVTVRASRDRVGGRATAGLHVPITARDVERCLAEGATVCIDPIDRACPPLADYAAAVRRQLHHAGSVRVKCYASAAGFGFNLHFDRQITTTLQIEGRKRWRYSIRPAVEFPWDNGFATADGAAGYVGRLPSSLKPWEQARASDAEFEEVVLEPGDVLCLPAGTWHEAKAVDDALALNLSFAPLEAVTFFAAVLRSVLGDRPEWRRNLPAYTADPARPGRPDPHWSSFVADRLAELHEAVRRPAAEVAERVWGELIESGGGGGRPAFVALAERLPQPGHPGVRHRSDAEPGSAFDGTVSVTIGVRSLPDAIAWYTGVLGFRLRHSVQHLNWCELETPTAGLTIGLTESAQPAGGALVSFGVVDLERERTRLEALGVTFDGPTQEIPNAARLAPFFDPDGNRFMLTQVL